MKLVKLMLLLYTSFTPKHKNLGSLIYYTSYGIYAILCLTTY